MKTRILLMLLLVSSLSFAQWQIEGATQFTNNSLDVDITTDINDVPYVVYSDITDGLVHVKKFNGTSWVDVGTNATGIVVPTLLSIAINPVTGHPWVAYRNGNTNRVDIIKYNGTSWSIERASLNNFDPKNKIILKFSPTGNALLGTEKAGTAITNATFYLYAKRSSGSWSNELTSAIFSNCFDIQSYDKVSMGFPYKFTNWRPRLHTYTYTGTTWSLTANTGYTPSGGVNAYIYSLSAANGQILHHYNEQRSAFPINSMYLNVGANPPSGGSPTKKIVNYEYSSFSTKNYGLFFDSSENLQIQEYNAGANSWTNLNVGLSFTGVNPNAKLEVNQTGDKVYVAYLDNSKVTVRYYTVIAPVSQVYVNLNATGNNDGTSWADAYTNLQDAIDNHNPPTQVWVAQGTYIPTGNGRSSTFLIDGKAVKVYGGFSGTETMLSERDPKNNITILSGDINQDDNTNLDYSETTRSDNAYHILSFKEKGTGSIIDGFTISGGNANGALSNSCSTGASSQIDNRRGGAVYAQAYSSGSIQAIISNCILENNSGSDTAVYSTFGPCGQQSISVDMDFESCIVRNNYSGTNSAFLFAGSSQYNQYSKGSLVNSVFYNNTSVSSSAAIYLSSGTSTSSNSTGIQVDIINSTFSNNTGVNGSVIKMVRANNTTIKNSIIYGNGSIIPFDITTSASVVSNSIIQGVQIASGLNLNPLFTDAVNNDFTLSSTSPAIDAGDNANVPTGITTDLLGNARIFNTTVDMGVYEYGSALGTNNFETNNDFSIYPNPTTSFLNIKMNQDFEKAEIYNIQGQKVLESKNKRINVSKLSTGMYLMKIETVDGNVSTKRFIKK